MLQPLNVTGVRMARKRPIAGAKPLWDRHAPTAATRSNGKLGRVQQFFFRDVWEPDVRTLPFLRRCVFRVSRVLYLTVSGFMRLIVADQRAAVSPELDGCATPYCRRTETRRATV